MKDQTTRQWRRIGFGLLLSGMITCGVVRGADLTDQARAFVAEHEKAVRPLEVTASGRGGMRTLGQRRGF